MEGLVGDRIIQLLHCQFMGVMVGLVICGLTEEMVVFLAAVEGALLLVRHPVLVQGVNCVYGGLYESSSD